MARPELGAKRLCPNCGAKYYDLNRDPILCPKCNAVFSTGIVAARGRAVKDEEEEEEADEGVQLVTLEEAVEGEDAEAVAEDDEIAVADEDVTVDADDDALIDDTDDDDEVSDVVRGAEEDEEER